MKQTIIALLFTLCFVGCDDNDTDTGMCMQGVKIHYVNNKSVFLLPGHSFKFIVVDSNGAVLYVETMGKWNEITKELVIEKAK